MTTPADALEQLIALTRSHGDTVRVTLDALDLIARNAAEAPRRFDGVSGFLASIRWDLGLPPYLPGSSSMPSPLTSHHEEVDELEPTKFDRFHAAIADSVAFAPTPRPTVNHDDAAAPVPEPEPRTHFTQRDELAPLDPDRLRGTLAVAGLDQGADGARSTGRSCVLTHRTCPDLSPEQGDRLLGVITDPVNEADTTHLAVVAYKQVDNSGIWYEPALLMHDGETDSYVPIESTDDLAAALRVLTVTLAHYFARAQSATKED